MQRIKEKLQVKNALNLPYLDSDLDPLVVEMETPKEGIPGTSSKKRVSKKPKV
jgi:hypothetical protein